MSNPERLAVEGRDPPHGIANATVGEVHAYGGKIISAAEAARLERADRDPYQGTGLPPGTVHETFDTIAARDAWLDEHAPQRQAAETPGLYRLPDDSALSVQGFDVYVYPPARGAQR
jgi:hypothetical protein